MQNNERMDTWNKKSWLDEFVSSPRLATDLTSIYAEDVLQAVSDNSFNNLDEAIASLKAEVGLTTAEVNDIKRVVLAATDPQSFVAEENIRKAKKSELAQLLVLATTECEECKKAPCECSHKLSTPVAKAIARIGLETLAEMCDKAEVDTPEAEEKKEEESAELKTEASRISEAGGMNPGFQAYLDKKKKEKEGGKASDEETTDKAEDKKEAEASLKAKAEKWATFLTSKGYFQGANEPVNTSDGVSNDKTNSNDPTKLGYGTKEGIQYDRKDMAVPVGEDARPYEQKAFEGAAAETAKVMGPKGEELKVKELWQRAKYMSQVRKIRAEKNSK